MEQYRQPDQYYIDRYDRISIRHCKELEKEIKEKLKSRKVKDKKSSQIAMNMGLAIKKIDYWKQKKVIINDWIAQDEAKDRMIQQTPVLDIITCRICGDPMLILTHFFRNNDTVLLFVYECPHKHFPRRGFYANGTEYVIPENTCSKCGYTVKTTTKRGKNELKYIETCTGCGKLVTDVFDLTVPKEKPINEKERKKYCFSDEEGEAFTKSLNDLGKLGILMEEKEKKKLQEIIYQTDKIIRLTVPKIDKKMIELSSALDYAKFQMDKPELGRHVIVPFSVQDPSERNENESIKVLKKGIDNSLFKTNWRLTSPGISYRLGFLQGKLKAYEDEEGLLKIAKEIKKKESGKSDSEG